jgi:dTDP-4-amino-4,6-dideoxygalactose transaminase
MGPAERNLLLNAFDSNWIAPLGPHVEAFEHEFAEVVGVPHACALSSGTAALHLALLMLEVGRGDSVITSTLTFAATANAIRYVEADPTFIDCEPQSWNIDPDLLVQELDERGRANRLPKAVIVVDLYGQCPDFDRILAACNRWDVPVIEDAAEALGARYGDRCAGALGLISVFSFNGNKIITTGGGGMLVSTRQEFADRARFLATQARDPAPHYQHSTIGFNYRLSNLLAAVGRGQLRVLDERIAQRRANNAFYRGALGDEPGISFLSEAPWGRATHWLTCVQVDPAAYGATREGLRLAFGAREIEARPVWKPMHLQPIFASCRAVGGKVAQELFEFGLCLPSGSSLRVEEREEVAGVVCEVGRRARSAGR